MDRGPWGYFGYPASIAALASFHLSVAVLNLCMNNGAARSGSVLSHIASNNLETRLFTSSADPVGAGLVASLGRPSGNATGFSSFKYSIGGKWLELLKQIAPTVTRVAVVRDPNVPAGIGQFGAIQAVAPYVGVELRPIDTRDSSEIEQAMNAFTRQTGGGLIVTQNTSVLFHRKLIIALAARHRLPAVYASRFLVTDGGLLSYGPNLSDNYRRAASYVDRILKGEKPADLPVQNPAKYELVINLKTAKALGLEVPPMLLTRADEVIE